MHGDDRTPRRTLVGLAALAAAGLGAVAAPGLVTLPGAGPGEAGTGEPAPAIPAVEGPAVEEWHHDELPEDGWLWDDDALDGADGFGHWPPTPDEHLSPFAATTAEDPLNLLDHVFPAA